MLLVDFGSGKGGDYVAAPTRHHLVGPARVFLNRADPNAIQDDVDGLSCVVGVHGGTSVNGQGPFDPAVPPDQQRIISTCKQLEDG